MIFAAGLGTRLAPLTDNRPKALVEFQGKTMLENAINKLEAAGVNRIIINIHHFANMMAEYIHNIRCDAELLISDERDFLLDTGGGILKAAPLLCTEDNFIAYNVDIACDIDLKALYNYHLSSGNLATLAIKDRESTRKLIFNKEMQLCGWHNYTTNETKISRNFEDNVVNYFAFSGISIINKNIFPLITETGKFSITNLFLRLATTERIGGYVHDGKWADLGTIEKLKKAEVLFGYPPIHITGINSILNKNCS